MVYVTSANVQWQSFIEPWLDRLPSSLMSEWKGPLLKAELKILVPPLFDLIFDGEDHHQKFIHPGFSTNWQMKSYLSILEAFLLKDHTRESLIEKEEEDKDKREAKEEAARLGAETETTPRNVEASYIMQQRKKKQQAALQLKRDKAE
mmetsp:Transcript_30359/g.46465  ORF Transcript_30359/g.46465 Transcript_30359/m.46465 type:complete len:148 (-) Transcript_30359:843-1286(-)